MRTIHRGRMLLPDLSCSYQDQQLETDEVTTGVYVSILCLAKKRKKCQKNGRSISSRELN